MLEKLSEKDQKTVKMGGVAVLALAVLFVTYTGYQYWVSQKKLSKALERDLKTLNLSPSAHKNLLAAVPVFQMPVDAEKQKTFFRNSVNLLFEDMRISAEPLVEVAASKTTTAPPGCGVLCLKTSTSRSVSLQNILLFLADLKKNPYLVGIEELKITCDQDNPQSASFSIVLSTFVNNKRT